MKTSCHLTFASQGPKPAASAAGGNTGAWLPYIGPVFPGVTKSDIPVTKHQSWCGPSSEPSVREVPGFWEAYNNSTLPWLLLRLLRAYTVQITHSSM